MSSEPSLEDLQAQWKTLYSKQLPALAKTKDPAQSHWPVQLDHCFARIILDNAVGKDRPWAQVIKSPAYKNMTRKQLQDAIGLGEKLACGDEDLVALDERSLKLRGKNSKVQRKTASAARKRKGAEAKDDTRTQNEQKDLNTGEQGRKRIKRGGTYSQSESDK